MHCQFALTLMGHFTNKWDYKACDFEMHVIVFKCWPLGTHVKTEYYLNLELLKLWNFHFLRTVNFHAHAVLIKDFSLENDDTPFGCMLSSDVAIIADNRLSIAERLRLRWSIILFNNRLSPTSSWLSSVTLPIRPKIQCRPSSYFKYMTNKDLVLMLLLPKGSFTWNID